MPCITAMAITSPLEKSETHNGLPVQIVPEVRRRNSGGITAVTHVNVTTISFLDFLSLRFSNDSPANFVWGSAL